MKKRMLCCTLFIFILALTALPSAAMEKDDIAVSEIKISYSIQDREPVDSGILFADDVERLYCFTRVNAKINTVIQHVWYHNGNMVAKIPLSIGISGGWRTNSSKTIQAGDKGEWMVEIIAEDGSTLEMIEFVIE